MHQVLAQEESAMGNFLRTNGEQDKTQAGKMMNSVGKAMIYTARQRSTLKAPLARLHQVTFKCFLKSSLI